MRAAVATAVCFSILGIAIAAEGDAAVRKHTEIPAQRLETALQALAEERNLQVICRTEVVGDLLTPGATGELTRDEALKQLLAGTGLTYKYLDDKTITIAPLSSSSAIPISGYSQGESPNASVRGKAEGENSLAALEEPEGEGSRKSFWQRIKLAQDDSTAQKTDQSADREDEPQSEKLDEIVVTAQKRTERLQDVPISMSVLSGAALDRSTSVSIVDQFNRIPGVVADDAGVGGASAVVIRGVTAAAGLGAAGSATAAYYLDAVPFGIARSALSPDTNVYDLERVEVLRGPQGTLYGANALSGVVRVLTKSADLDNFALKVRTSVSSTELGGGNYRGDLAVNVPIIAEKLAARVVAGYQSTAGWIDSPIGNNVNDSKIRNGRIKLAAQPTQALSIEGSLWVYRSDQGQQPHINSAGTSDRQATVLALETPLAESYNISSLKAGYDFPAFSVSSTTGYLDYDNDYRWSVEWLIPGISSHIVGASKVLTEEFLVSSRHGGPWRWSLGGLYRDAKDRSYNLSFFNNAPLPGALPGIFRDKSKSNALFGELTRSFFAGRIELTGGLRYFEDEVSLIEDARANGSAPGAPAAAKFSKTTKRLVLNWHPDQDSTVYASYSEGFRSGSLQSPGVLGLFPGLPPSQPDDLINYELGGKAEWWSGKVSIDAALYYLKWDNAQQRLPTILPSGVTIVAITNAQSVSGMGSELALGFKPLTGLELGLTFGWNDLQFDTNTFRPGGTVIFLPKDGRISNSPEYTAGASADYTFGLGTSGYAGRLSVSGNRISEEFVYHTGITYVSPPNNRYAEPRWITHASFAVDSPDDRWSVSLFVDNFTNSRAMINLVPTPTPNGTFGIAVRPRTVGVQFDYKMGPK